MRANSRIPDAEGVVRPGLALAVKSTQCPCPEFPSGTPCPRASSSQIARSRFCASPLPASSGLQSAFPTSHHRHTELLTTRLEVVLQHQEWLGHSKISTPWPYDKRKARPEDSPTFKVSNSHFARRVLCRLDQPQRLRHDWRVGINSKRPVVRTRCQGTINATHGSTMVKPR